LIVIPYTVCDKNRELRYIVEQLNLFKIKIIKRIDTFRYHKFWKTFSELEKCKNYAKSKGGKLLSKVYLNHKTRLRWICKKGHIWESSWRNIRKGHWCKYCKNKWKQAVKTNGE